MDNLYGWMVVLTIIQVGLSIANLIFGFRSEKPEEFKPVEFDWKKEGF